MPIRLDFADAPAALNGVLALVKPDDAVLLKASRAVELEVVVSGLLAHETVSPA